MTVLYNAAMHSSSLTYIGILNKLLNEFQTFAMKQKMNKKTTKHKQEATFKQCHELSIPFAGTFASKATTTTTATGQLEINASQKGIRIRVESNGKNCRNKTCQALFT